MSGNLPVERAPSAAPEPIPLSALNHYLYCPRRAYLIHAEGVFVDNEHTVQGHLAHEHVDFPGYEQRAGWTLLRALPLFSDKLGLSGKADLVEVRYTVGDHIAEARPVEYKKGPKRRFGNDEVQLCAQALCLEEMFGIAIAAGAIFHAQSQQRHEVAFGLTLRQQTLNALAGLRTLLAQTAPPLAELKPQCEGCSLHGICLPEAAHSRAPRLFEPRAYV
ncbi:MAG TPA: CRISPR-associated protein Cas4 [Opitutaceae bacterium]|nr:CRISPR-associated protein Cas4 [Opitutaceae bacterium]